MGRKRAADPAIFIPELGAYPRGSTTAGPATVGVRPWRSKRLLLERISAAGARFCFEPPDWGRNCLRGPSVSDRKMVNAARLGLTHGARTPVSTARARPTSGPRQSARVWAWADCAVEKGNWARKVVGRSTHEGFCSFFYFISYSLFSIPKFNLNYKFWIQTWAKFILKSYCEIKIQVFEI
jgi:hypothetical protein